MTAPTPPAGQPSTTDTTRERSDDQRIMAGVPVDVEQGATPGAVQTLRKQLRAAAGNLCPMKDRIAGLESELSNARAEQEIWRDTCDELMDAIHALEVSR